MATEARAKACAVIPAYNEIETLPRLLEEFRRVREGLDLDVVFVDDGSGDGSREFFADLKNSLPWVRVVTHPRNLGFAAALKDGLNFALNAGYDFIGQCDCDLTHPPDLLPMMINLLRTNDMVIASRYIDGGGMREVPPWRVLMSRAGNFALGLLVRSGVNDMTSGFRASRREVLEAVSLKSDSFQIQLELTVKAERHGYRITEIPFVLTNRRAGASKFRLSHLTRYAPLMLELIQGTMRSDNFRRGTRPKATKPRG